MAAIPPTQAIKNALSAARVGTYEAATRDPQQLPGALALYAWNAKVSGAMLAPLHLCEVVVRNAVSDALAAVYGANWPWAPAFEGSLPSPPQGFSLRRELQSARNRQPSTGKAIAELKFAFWQKMFTGRFDAQIWNLHLNTVMPFLNPAWTVQQSRKKIYDDLESIRQLRNRIAHHEPIISRPLAVDFQKIQELIAFRCPLTANWMTNNQQAQALIAAKPI
ncbi:hypothetical protein [Burkholderia sp. BCC1998]|uniref:hypothetical protein n=1 Tax=Burkholderia sp. BCC1998 TaxID=2817447 RepID=UPI002AB6855F|nr:hypothetical protein [Burkholderia sp. BCC1998]